MNNTATTRPAGPGPRDGAYIPAATTRALVLLRRARRAERVPFGRPVAARLRARALRLDPGVIARRRALLPALFADN